MGFEITKVAVADTSVLHLKDAEGNLLWDYPETELEGAERDKFLAANRRPVEVELYGPGSREHGLANSRRQGRIMQRARKRGKAVMSADESNEEGALYLSDMTRSFRNMTYAGGEVTTTELIKAVYSDRKIGFIADQVQEYVNDWENFTKNSETS